MVEIKRISTKKTVFNLDYLGILKEETDPDTGKIDIFLDGINLNNSYNYFGRVNRHLVVFRSPTEETRSICPIKYNDVKEMCGCFGMVIFIENDRSTPNGPFKNERIIFLNNHTLAMNKKSLP